MPTPLLATFLVQPSHQFGPPQESHGKFKGMEYSVAGKLSQVTYQKEIGNRRSSGLLLWTADYNIMLISRGVN